MTEDDQDLLERIEGLLANAWDDDEHETLVEARDRIQDLIAEKEKLQTQYDEMGNNMLKHIGKAAEEIVRLELENDGLKAENERLKYLNDLNAVPAGIIEDRGRMEERTAIIAWLRSDKIVLSMDGSKEDVAASAIEAGEHLK